jgi:hypothetical protein
VASDPENVPSTGWLYQPFASGGRDAEADTLGAVPSYWSANEPELLVFPAASVQVPLTDALLESGPEYVVDVQTAIPDVASVPANDTATPWLYQPFASGERAAEAPESMGAVASRLIVTVTLTVPELFVVSQNSGVPVVSEEIVSGEQPSVLVTPVGSYCQTMSTLPVYQPEQSTGAGEQVGVATATTVERPPAASARRSTANAEATSSTSVRLATCARSAAAGDLLRLAPSPKEDLTPGVRTTKVFCMGLLALSHHAAGRIAELAFLLVAVAGVGIVLGSIGALRAKSANVLAGLALAVAGVALVIAFHWGRF